MITFTVQQILRDGTESNPAWIKVRAHIASRKSTIDSYAQYPDKRVARGQTYTGNISCVHRRGRTFTNIKHVRHTDNAKNIMIWCLEKHGVPFHKTKILFRKTGRKWHDVIRQAGTSGDLPDVFSRSRHKAHFVAACVHYLNSTKWQSKWVETFDFFSIENINSLASPVKELMRAESDNVAQWIIPARRILQMSQFWFGSTTLASANHKEIARPVFDKLATLIRKHTFGPEMTVWEHRLLRADRCAMMIRKLSSYWIDRRQDALFDQSTLVMYPIEGKYNGDDPFRVAGHLCTLERYDTVEGILVTKIKQLQCTQHQLSGIGDRECTSTAAKTELCATVRQKEAVHMALAHPVSAITGGAGSGKSTTLKMLYDRCVDVYRADSDDAEARVLVCAPTGKAAMRLRALGIRDACTLHKALCSTADLGPCPYIVILDEQSMQCPETLTRFLVKIDPAKLVFVGDPHQLYPVSPGSVFQDLLQCIPNTHLDVLFRFGSGTNVIAQNAEVIRQSTGGVAEFSQRTDEFEIIQISNTDTRLNVMVEEYLQMFAKGENVVVLAPTNRDIVLLNRTIYKRLYEIRNRREVGSLTPDEFAIRQRMRGRGFDVTRAWDKYRAHDWDMWRIYVGDRMMNTVNWYKESSDDDLLSHTRAFMNGEVGTVVKTDTSGINIRCNDGSVWVCDEAQIHKQIEPCHAITIHKSQGSEYGNVIIWLPYSCRRYTRNMFYTAVTRAKRRLIVYTTHGTIRNVIGTEQPTRTSRFLERYDTA